jgi:hypothetical protein
LTMFGRLYSFGVFSVIWGILTIIGIFLFIRFVIAKYHTGVGLSRE